jgi:DNA polymerase phi
MAYIFSKTLAFISILTHDPSDSLFANSSSDERKLWGFLFFLKSLDCASTPADLSAMFSKNFMRCMINQLADTERYLNKAAAKTSRALIAKAGSAPWTAPVVFRQLVTNHGTPNFDYVTKSKTIDKILCSADSSGLVEIVSELWNVILNPLASPPDVDPSKVAEARRQWAADQILSVIRNGKTTKNESWLRKVVEMFTTFGHFDVLDKKKKPAVPVSTNSQGMFRARLMSCLTHLIALKDVKQGEDEGESWPYIAFKTLGDLQGKKTKYKLAVEFDETISEAVDKATKSLEKLRKRRSSLLEDQTRTQLFSFELLYSLVILQVYNGESDALGVLEDLQSIQKKILTSKTEKPKKPKKKADDEDEVSPSEVLVDILLSFLSKPSVLLKRLAQTVFTSFCGSVTRGALERCFDVLATKEGVEGQATLFDDNDEDDEGSEEQDSDVEVLSAHEEDEDFDSDIEVLSASEEEDAATISQQEEEQRKLEAALKTVLDVPQDAGGDSDADMDDAEMLKLDEHIADIFRKQRAAASKKSRKKEAKELIVHFKTKVLELLEIFVKNSPDNPSALEILLPCLVLARTTRDQKLQEKALNVVRTFAHSSKREGLPKLREEHAGRAWKLLDHIHEEAGKGGQKGRKAACSSASILVVKTLVAHDPENLPHLSDVYAKSMVRWVQDTKFAVENSFFSDFAGWAGSVRGKLGKQEEPEEKKETKKTGKGKRKRNNAGDEDEEAAEEVLPALKTNGRGKNKTKRRKKGMN